jgi:hypothetical protein
MHVDLTNLRLFRDVAEAGSITGGAARNPAMPTRRMPSFLAGQPSRAVSVARSPACDRRTTYPLVTT